MESQPVPIRATTQAFLEISDVDSDLVILKSGSVCLILQVAAINFSLLSETEQDALIFAYRNLLNSLSFPIQILIRSKRKDISLYLEFLEKHEEKLPSEVLKVQLKKYRRFIEETVSERKVLDKKFYVVIPFSNLELGAKRAYPRSYILERAKMSLLPKRDHLIRQLNRLGLKSEQLGTQKLIELFYDIYNPAGTGGQKIVESSQYSQPLVEAAMEEEKEPSLPEGEINLNV